MQQRQERRAEHNKKGLSANRNDCFKRLQEQIANNENGPQV